MINESVYDIVARCILLKDLNPADFQRVVEAGRLYSFPKGTLLFHEGEPAEVFYIVIEGHVKLIQTSVEGHQVTVSYVGPGGGIGIIVALSNMDYPVSAEVTQECRVLAWSEHAITELMKECPQLALNGMHLIAGRFVQLQRRFRELSTERVERRVARALLRLVRQTGRRVEAGVLIDMPLSRQDLAEMTGTTLYSVSRILSGWEQKGYVQTGREQVTISNPHQLVVIAEDLPEQKKK